MKEIKKYRVYFKTMQPGTGALIIMADNVIFYRTDHMIVFQRDEEAIAMFNVDNLIGYLDITDMEDYLT